MTNYTVDLQDSVDYQSTQQVDAGSKEEAASIVVSRVGMSAAEAEDVHAFVYETGSESIDDSEIFEAALYV